MDIIMNEKKKKKGQSVSSCHHYRPRFYLEKFVDPALGKLLVFEKGNINPKNNFQPIKYVAFKTHFHTIQGYEEYVQAKGHESLTDKRGRVALADELETTLSGYETKTSKHFKSIVKNKSLHHLSTTDISLVIEWMMWLYIDHPNTEEILFKRNPTEIPHVRISGFIDWNKNKKVHSVFRAKWWCLVQCPSFLFTSDQSIILYPKPVLPIDYKGLHNATIYFPISPDLVLIGYPCYEPRFLKKTLTLNEKGVFFINLLTYQLGGKCFSRDIATRDKFLLSLQRYRLVTALLKIKDKLVNL